ETYNQEDCLATLMLRDWLLTQKSEAEATFGVQIPSRRPPTVRSISPESVEALDETARLRDALLADSEPGDERWLMAQLLDYHRREARPGWWWYYRRRREMDDDDLLEDAESIAGLAWNGAEPVLVKRSREYTFTFPPQQHRFDGGD